MARSWKEAKDVAAQENRPCVYHNHLSGEYGACTPESRRRRITEFTGFQEACICMPARLSTEEMEEKERRFLEGNPDWRGAEGCSP